MKNKIVYYEETVVCQHLIFWPGSQRRINCHTAKPEGDKQPSAPCYADVLGSRGKAPHILNLGSRQRWVVSFMSQLLYPWGNNHGTHWIRGWVNPKAGLDIVMKRKLLPCQESNLSHPAHSLVTTLTVPTPQDNIKNNF
jgi:hypothetical protein